MTTYADPATVVAKAQGWTAAQLACRMNKHSWPPLTHRMTLLSHGRGYYEVGQRCIRNCGVTRSQTRTEKGYASSDWSLDYSKAEGYLMEDDEGKPLGRIDQHGQAALWLLAVKGATVREIPDE